MFWVLARFRVLVGFCIVLVVFALGVLLLVPSPVGTAGEFDQLLDEATQRGVQVDAARSRNQAAEASVRKAWSKFLPSIRAQGEFGHNKNDAFGRFKGIGRNSYDNSQYGISSNLPLYRGGAHYYGLKQAQAMAVAEGYSFKETRQLLLLDTARAILGVIRDREIVRLQRENRVIVRSILKTTESQFEGGEATRTDIDLAQDQFTAAQSVYAQALDLLHQNETEFQRLIGRSPGRLSVPKGVFQRLPKSLHEATLLAEQDNPQLLAALKRADAAQHSLKASYSKFLPSVDLNMDYTEERFHGVEADDESDFSVKLNFSVPLFQPDALPASEESRHVAEQRQYEARDARYTAKAMAKVAWNSYQTARKRYHLALRRIRAAASAAKGMRRELEVGQRTVLDVLDTQERLVQAKVGAANAKFERYMAAHLLLSSVGQLDVRSTGVTEIETYLDAAANNVGKPLKSGQQKKWKRAQTDKIKTQKTTDRAALPVKGDRGQGRDLPWTSRTAAFGASFLKRVAKIDLPVLKGGEERPLAAPVKKAPVAVKSPVEKKTPVLRKSIYSNNTVTQDDEIVTGALPWAVPDGEGSPPKAFSVHQIPLPLKKSLDVEGEKPSVLQEEEEFPDTWQNRFAVWWNSGVDQVIGPDKGPRPVLVPLEEYHKKRAGLGDE